MERSGQRFAGLRLFAEPAPWGCLAQKDALEQKRAPEKRGAFREALATGRGP